MTTTIQVTPDAGAFAHLSAADVEALGNELDALREEVMATLGAEDAAYIHNVINWQRALAVGGRLSLFAAILPPAWLAGTAMLTTAKILENMELGHNVMHGQWDWMNDPEIHSSSWEWDNVCPAENWKHSHNAMHHVYTNVVGKDRDVGYGILRMSPDQPWSPGNLGQPVYNALLALFFEWGVALHDVEFERLRSGRKSPQEALGILKSIAGKVRKQVTKDYVVFPLLAGPGALATLSANVTANIVRNLWSYTIIFCGHFPDGAVRFTEAELEDETRGAWYLRQMLGSANITGGRFFHLLAGNLGYQIEHHLFPDMPSNRYAELAVRVQEICERYEIPYTTGPLRRQYGQTMRTILRLSLPTPEAGTAPPPEPLRRVNGPVQERQLRATG